MTALKKTQGRHGQEQRFPACTAQSEGSLSPAESLRAVSCGYTVEGRGPETQAVCHRLPQSWGKDLAGSAPEGLIRAIICNSYCLSVVCWALGDAFNSPGNSTGKALLLTPVHRRGMKAQEMKGYPRLLSQQGNQALYPSSVDICLTKSPSSCTVSFH